MTRKNLRRLVLILVILVVFLAPVVPTNVTRFWLLPWRNQCIGGIPSLRDPQFQPVPVYASISYIGFQLLIDVTARTNHCLFGLIMVPNDGADTFQFPPLKYQNVKCL